MQILRDNLHFYAEEYFILFSVDNLFEEGLVPGEVHGYVNFSRIKRFEAETLANEYVEALSQKGYDVSIKKIVRWQWDRGDSPVANIKTIDEHFQAIVEDVLYSPAERRDWTLGKFQRSNRG